MFHLLLHFLLPLLVSLVFFGKKWKTAFVVMAFTQFVDLDHLVAVPIYQPLRCSIGFHPLHQLWFIGFYLLACFHPKTRLIGLGLMMHMALDSIDCQINSGQWIFTHSQLISKL